MEHFHLSNILSIARIKTFIICFIQYLSKFNKIRTILPSVNTAKLLFTSLPTVVLYPICVGYTLTRNEYTAVELFIVH